MQALGQPGVTWQICYGGTSDDVLTSVSRTLDGGYIGLGKSSSNDFDLSDICCPFGSSDIWVIKLDSNLQIEWQRLYPYDNNPIDEMIQIFANVDTTYTLFGAIEGAGELDICTCNHSVSQDIWMVTLNELGDIISQNCYGGSSFERLNSVAKSLDGGYLIGGSSGSADGDVGVHYGSDFTTDGLIIKTDSVGGIEWTKVLGGSGNDGAIVQSLSGNQAFINLYTSSHDYDLEGIMPDSEISGRLLLVTDDEGNQIKENFLQTYNLQLELNYIYEMENGKFILLGTNEIDTGIYAGNHGGNDAAIGILDSNLDLIGFHQFGGSEGDQFSRIFADNSNYYFYGYSYSSDYDCQDNEGESDIFIVKTDTTFSKIWSLSLGASGLDRLAGMYNHQNQLLIFGYSGVGNVNDGDILNAHYDEVVGDNGEVFAMILDDFNSIISPGSNLSKVNVYPNPTFDQLIIQCDSSSLKSLFITLYSMDGNLVLRSSLPYELNYIEINDISQGLYIYTITDDTNTLIKSDSIVIY